MLSSITRKTAPYIAALVVGLIALLALVSGGSPTLPRAQATTVAAVSSAAPSAVTTARPAVAKAARPVLSAHQRHLLHLKRVAAKHRSSAKAGYVYTSHGKHYIHGVVLSRHNKPPMVHTRWGLAPANTYHGKWYDPSALTTRNCIVMRESMGHPTSINSAGYSGLYQFGLSWTHTLQGFTGEHVAIVQMSYQAQDLAFWRVWNFGKGAGNWAGGRWACPRV